MVSLFNNLKYTMPAFKFPQSEVVYLHARVRICFPGKAFEAIGIVFRLHFCVKNGLLGQIIRNYSSLCLIIPMRRPLGR